MEKKKEKEKEIKKTNKNFEIKSKELVKTIKQFVKIAHFDNIDMPYYIQKWIFKNKINEYFDIYTIIMENEDNWYYFSDLSKNLEEDIIYGNYEYDIDFESEYHYRYYKKIPKNKKIIYKNKISNKNEEIAGIFLIPKNINQIIENQQYITIINAHMDKIESRDIKIEYKNLNNFNNLKTSLNTQKLTNKNKKLAKIIKTFNFNNGCVIALYDDYKLQRLDGKPIGGDDRCGITIMLKLLANSKKHEELRNHIYLFTNYEESGLKGIKYIQNLLENNNKINKNNELKELKQIINKIKNNVSFIIGLDRKGSYHYVNYHYKINEELGDLLKKEFGLIEDRGSISDVRVISEIFDVDHINLAVGFYDSHNSDENVKITDLLLAYKIVYNLLKNKKNKFLNKKYEINKQIYRITNIYENYKRTNIYLTKSNLIKGEFQEYWSVFSPEKINNNLKEIENKIKIYKLFDIAFPEIKSKKLNYLIKLTNNKNNINENETYFLENSINLYAYEPHMRIYEYKNINPEIIVNINGANFKLEELKYSNKLSNYYSYLIRTFQKIDENYIHYKEINVNCSNLIERNNYFYKFVGPLEIFVDNFVYANSKLLLFNFVLIEAIKHLSFKNEKNIYEIINSPIFFEGIPSIVYYILKNKNIIIDLKISIMDLNQNNYNIDVLNKIFIDYKKEEIYYNYAVDYELKFKYL